MTRVPAAEPRSRGASALSARLRAVGKTDVPPPEAAPPLRRRAARPGPAARGGESTVPPALAIAGAWAWRALAVGAVAYFVLGFLGSLSLVVVPLVIAIILAALLHRPAVLLRRYLPRSVAGILVLLGAAGVLFGVGWFVAVRVQGQSNQLVTQVQGVIDQVQAKAAQLPGIGNSSSGLVDKLNGWVQAHSSTLLSGVFTVGKVAADAVTGLVLTLFLTLFFLIDGDRVWAWTIRLLPRRAQPATNGAGHRAWSVLSGYITGTALIALIHGVVIGVALWLLGTPLVIALAVLVFVGSFIPIIGAFVFGGISVLVTLVTVSWQHAVILLIVLVVENLLEGHVYQPLIMGHSVSLHPVAIVLALAAGGVLGGIVGAIVAIPVVGSVHAAIKYLTGVEDIHGHALRAEDRMEPEEPPEALLPRGQRPGAGAARRTSAPAPSASPANGAPTASR